MAAAAGGGAAAAMQCGCIAARLAVVASLYACSMSSPAGLAPAVMLLLAAASCTAAAASSPPSTGDAPRDEAPRRPFSALEFEKLKRELHTLSAEDAERRFREVIPMASPPPRQDKIDHMVVLFMENRAFDHVLGCLVGDKPGADGVPKGGMKIPKDPKNASGCAACANSTGCAGCAGFTNATCGKAELVCHGGGGFSIFGGHLKNTSEASAYPYGEQGMGYGVPESVSSFDETQLPVKKGVVDHFGTLNRYFVSVPSASTPNHLFAQSATSCGIHGNIMYSSCQGPTDTFPQLTIYDSMHLHNVSFSLFMNSTCGSNASGLDGSPCHGVSPHTADAGSPVPTPDVAMVGVGRYVKQFKSQSTFYRQAAAGTLPQLSWLMPNAQACDHPCCECCSASSLFHVAHSAQAVDSASAALRLPRVSPRSSHCAGNAADDMAKGDRLLKDVYEGLRAGKAWNKTMLVVVYDDTGGWYLYISGVSKSLHDTNVILTCI